MWNAEYFSKLFQSHCKQIYEGKVNELKEDQKKSWLDEGDEILKKWEI